MHNMINARTELTQYFAEQKLSIFKDIKFAEIITISTTNLEKVVIRLQPKYTIDQFDDFIIALNFSYNNSADGILKISGNIWLKDGNWVSRSYSADHWKHNHNIIFPEIPFSTYFQKFPETPFSMNSTTFEETMIKDAKSNRFDLEASIMDCWNVVNDINLIGTAISDSKIPLTEDQIQNYLIGLEAIYQLKFEKLFKIFESSI